MRLLNDILGRPPDERSDILFSVDRPKDDCTVAEISEKPLDEVVAWLK